MAVPLCHVGDDNTRRLEVGRFEILEQPKVVLLKGRHTIVANQWLGEDQNLSTVGGIRQGFGVADQRGGEDGFTRDVGASSERLPMEDGAVSNREGGGLVDRSLASSGHETRLGADIDSWEVGGLGGHSLEESSEHDKRRVRDELRSVGGSSQ